MLAIQWLFRQPELVLGAQLPTFQLLKEFKGAWLGEASADGQKMCLVFFRTPVKTLFVPPDRSLSASYKADGNMCSVFDVGTWERTCSFQLRGNVSEFSFLLGGDELYASSSLLAGRPPVTVQHALVKTGTGELAEWVEGWDRRSTIAFEAGAGSSLLGVRGQRELVKRDLPSYAEVQSVDLAIARREALLRNTNLVLPADHSLVAYGVDHSIICRRVSDLGVIWTAPVEADVELSARCIAMAANGSRVAVAPWKTDIHGGPRRFYTAVFDARDGSLVARWPIDGSTGIALSADGTLLAVAGFVNGGIEITISVRIFEVTSGREIASIVHDRTSGGRDQYMNAMEIRIRFTADGQFMLTSSLTMTKVWRIG